MKFNKVTIRLSKISLVVSAIIITLSGILGGIAVYSTSRAENRAKSTAEQNKQDLSSCIFNAKKGDRDWVEFLNSEDSLIPPRKGSIEELRVNEC